MRTSALATAAKSIFPRILVLGLVYFSIHQLGLMTAVAYGGVAPLWPCVGVGFICVYLFGVRVWPVLLLAELASGVLSFSFSGAVCLVAVGNVAASVLGYKLFTVFVKKDHLWRRTRSMLWFIGLVSVSCAVIAAAWHLVAPMLGGSEPALWTHSPIVYAGAWCVSVVTGFLLLVPVFLAWKERVFLQFDGMFSVEALLLLAGILACVCLEFGTRASLGLEGSTHAMLAFACVPLIVWAAFRMDYRLLGLALLVSGVIACAKEFPDSNTYAIDEALRSLAGIQSFFLAVVIVALIVYAHVRESARNVDSLQDSRAELRAANELLEDRVRARTQDLQKALRDSQAVLHEQQAMYENAVQGMFQCTFTGRVIQSNPAFALLLGYDHPDELEQIDDLAMAHFYRPDQFQHMVRALEEHGVLKDYELHLRGAELQPLWGLANIILRVDPDGDPFMEGILVDNSARKWAEERLRRSEELYRRIINTSGEGFLLLDQGFTVRDVNRTLCVALGLSREAIIGKHASELLLGPELVKAPWPDPATTYEAIFKRHKGADLPALVHAGVLEGAKSKVEARFVFITDITELKQAQAMREDVERIMRHDLKSPLNAIINLPTLLLEGEVEYPQDDKEILEMITSSGSHMLEMINRSLDLYKMEKGAYKLVAREVELLPLLRKIIDEQKSLIESLGITLEIYVEDRLVCVGDQEFPVNERFVVTGESQLLRNAFANLIKNSVEASPKGGRVRIQLRDTGENHEICIYNQGVVPERIRHSFFEKYVTSGKSSGTGLGTYSARLIAQTHGGDIDMASSENKGTAVTVILPKYPT